MFQTLLYYKYVNLQTEENVQKFFNTQVNLCKSLGLKGRVLIAKEGINGTVEGTIENTNRYIQELHSLKEFKDTQFKISPSDGNNFPKLSIKIKDEIVATRLDLKDKIGPHNNVTGKYLEAHELHSWIHSDKEFYIIDMRNDYEHQVGYFEGSFLPTIKNFRELPTILPSIAHLKNKTVVTVCTGGVRCEKASGFLQENGFTEVYQLKDGIVTYMEKYPNQDFVGKLYVFDNRKMMGFNTDSDEHISIGKCQVCGNPSENIVDYWQSLKRFHGIVCTGCIDSKKVLLDMEINPRLNQKKHFPPA
jgi:UPF0176 protein